MFTKELLALVKKAAEEWARDYFHTDKVIGYVSEDAEDEPGRFIVSLATPTIDDWQAVEVWVENWEVVAVNWLGEGLPPEDVEWPWEKQ